VCSSDLLVQSAGECGLRSIVILMGALDGLKVKPEILSYEGPFGVGYLVASLEVIV
jgi:aromatic ring-opening dioxygenase LigB subunit